MDFNALEELGNEILQDAVRDSLSPLDSPVGVNDDYDDDDLSDVEMKNTFSILNQEAESSTSGDKSGGPSPGVSALPSTSKDIFAKQKVSRTRFEDHFGEEAMLEETLAVLEAVVPVTDRRLYSIISTLKESRFPTRANSSTALAFGTGRSVGGKREDLMKRLFPVDGASGDAAVSVEAILMRDLLCEELKHCSRLQSLQHTVIEPLEAQIRDGRCNWMKLSDHATIFQNFTVVSNAQFDHATTLTKMMADWPAVKGTNALFQKWVFSIPLYAELAQTLNYSTHLLIHIQNHPLSKKSFRQFLASREAEPRLAARSSIFMPIPDLLNEPFNHLPKYQFFIESLLSHHSRNIFINNPPSSSQDPENAKSDLEPSNDHIHFAQSCQTLAILQQSLTYLTKCYHHSENMSKLRKIVDRLGSEAPHSLRNYEQRKIYGGDETLVYITDHRRRRRKRGFVMILSDSLLLVRCADISASQAGISVTTPSNAGSSASGSTVQSAIVGNRQSVRDSTFNPDALKTPPPSVPVDSKAAKLMGISAIGPSSESKAQKKERKEADKRAKLQKESHKHSIGDKHSQPSPPIASSSERGSSQNSSASNATGSSNSQFSRPGATSAPAGPGVSRSSFSSAISPVQVPMSASTGTTIAPPQAVKKTSSASLISGISRSLAQSCPLRFIAMLFFDQLGLQMDAPMGYQSDSPTVIIWASDTKFTIEFEQQEHKQAWLHSIMRHMQKGSAKSGPFGKSLSELYSQPSRGVPSSLERFEVLDEFLSSLEASPAILEHAVPPFVAWLFDSVVTSFMQTSLDGDTLIRAPIPPRNDQTWKQFKQSISEDWMSISLSEYPTVFVLTLLCRFCAKLPDPLIPTQLVDLISSQWEEEDCIDPLKIKRLVQQLPAFNLYTLGYLCQALHQLIASDKTHRCPFMNDGKIQNSAQGTSESSASASLHVKRPRASRESVYQAPKMLPSPMNIQISQPFDASHASTLTPPPFSTPISKSSSKEVLFGESLAAVSASGPTTGTRKSNEISPVQARSTGSLDSSNDVPYTVSGESSPSPQRNSHQTLPSVDEELRASCQPTALAMLLSAAFSPTIVRPFKLRPAKPVAVGNFIGRLPRVVRFFACLIDHAPQVFSPLKRISSATVVSSFAELKAQLQRSVMTATVSTIDPSLLPTSSNATEPLSPSSIASNPAPTEGRRPRDARRGAAIFNFDMSGLVTETFSIQDFSSLHFALTPSSESF